MVLIFKMHVKMQKHHYDVLMLVISVTLKNNDLMFKPGVAMLEISPHANHRTQILQSITLCDHSHGACVRKDGFIKQNQQTIDEVRYH